MKAGILVDDWKLPVFRRRLTEAGYDYEDGGAPRPGITILKVKTDKVMELADLLKECQDECARAGKP